VREFQWRGGVSETASTDDSPTIVEQIRASADRLTERERKAAQTLLTDDPTAGLGPVAEFAQRARVRADRPALCRQARMSWLPGFQEAIARRTGGPARVAACQAGAYGQAAAALCANYRSVRQSGRDHTTAREEVDAIGHRLGTDFERAFPEAPLTQSEVRNS
jgi:hypothetical protein